MREKQNIAVEVRSFLNVSAEEEYKRFNRSLIPGDIAPILGVRIPVLRKIAKKIAKDRGREYLEELYEAEKKGQVCYEELLLHGMVIGYLDCRIEERKRLLDLFIPFIDNWSVCDSSCITYKFMKGDMEEWFAYLCGYVGSQEEYGVRFAIVCMLNFFVTEQFIFRVLKVLEEVRHEGYYVKMAAAWAVSVCYVKFPEAALEFLKNNALDDFTHNKAIQKIRESLQVSTEEKEALKKWLR